MKNKRNKKLCKNNSKLFTALINNNLRLHDDVKFALKTILQTKLVFYIFLTDGTGADLEILVQILNWRSEYS